MTSNLYLFFPGNCDAAFAYYEQVFGTRRAFTSRYRDAPSGTPVDPASLDLVMHTSLPVGSFTLMGSDMLPGQTGPFAGFQVSLDDPDEAAVRELFGKLSEGGQVRMPLQPTFWTPLFGMCTDRFGVGWMLSQPGPQPDGGH